MESFLLDHYRQIEERVGKACAAAGRNRSDVLLLAVSKFHPAEDIACLAAAGQYDFGENYVQEAAAKREFLAQKPEAKDIRWHLIGHIQRRKAKDVAGAYNLIHTLDSIELADEMEKRLTQKGANQKVLLEINVGGERQKPGIKPEDAGKLARHVFSECPHLELRGLMCIPPVFDAGEAARPWFALLARLRSELEQKFGRALPELSMGMSGDFASAIAEGATIIRIGTGIFGPRPIKRA